jgi:hypothetical protein
MTVSRELIAEFIELCHGNSLLWKVTSKDCFDQVKKTVLRMFDTHVTRKTCGCK